MDKQPFFYIANWKMRLTHNQALDFVREHKNGFEKLAIMSADKKIIVCPSVDVLAQVAALFHGTRVIMGAQNCSAYPLGNYTGEVAAESLAQLGCHFCIVGHSERRALCAESNNDIAHKMERLVQHNMTPILCVGETRQEYERHETITVITQQLKAAFQWIKKMQGHIHVCIAYEPVWAIGTGLVASQDHIEGVFKNIFELMSMEFPWCKYSLLYGGSVDEKSAPDLAKIHGLGGFLIGGASLEFKKFEKIVTLRT